MEVRRIAQGTYKIFSEYDRKNITISAQELTLLFDHLLENIGRIQVEAIEQRQRKLEPQAQKGRNQ